MRSPCSALLLVPVLLAGVSPARAQPLPCQAGAPRLTLAAQAQPPAEICIRAGQFTPFVFDTPLASGAVVLEGREHFRDVEVTSKSVLLVPGEQLPPGARLQLEVRFADGQAPERARFTLVAHPEQFARQVDVSRASSPAGSCEARATQLREELRRCSEQLGGAAAAPGSSPSLSVLVADGTISEAGVDVDPIKTSDFSQHSESGLKVMRLSVYRTDAVLLLAVAVKNQVPGSGWALEGASLTGPDGVLQPAKAPHPSGPLAPGDTRRFLVEWTLRRSEAPLSYTLQLWDAGKARTVTLRNLKLH
jgi:uncharacterized protein (TIGR02268 family)